MAQLHITNLNPSDSVFIEELTEEELLEINGGSIGDIFNKIRDIPVLKPAFPILLRTLPIPPRTLPQFLHDKSFS